MTESALLQLLTRVAAGTVDPAEGLASLRSLPFTELPEAIIDTHREVRLGMPEVVLASHKTAQQIGDALETLFSASGYALATRVCQDKADALSSRFPQAKYDAVSRLFSLGEMEHRESWGQVAVVCAGTSDLPVAEEAAHTLEFSGVSVCRIRDVGVAGLPRLFAKLPLLRDCNPVITIAGMEGALPGVLAGLIPQPIIAVPTSVGYGANFNGVSALLAMLNSCASGMGVVNIDNGFGAAMLALRMLRMPHASRQAA